MDKWVNWALIAAMLFVSLVVPGAGQGQAEDRLHVVASFSILADVVSNIAGEAASVSSLIPLGTGPHGFSPTPQDVVELAEADAVFVVGANFEEVLMDSIANADEDMSIIVASSCVNIQPIGTAHEETENFEDEEPGPSSEMAEMCDAHHAALAGLAPPLPGHVPQLGPLYAISCSDEHNHEQVGCDGHVWTDPYNVMLWALVARDTLSALDPPNAEVYAANTETYIADLAELFDKVSAMITTIPKENRKLVTNHQAYSYYANRFGLEMAGTIIPAASTLAEPSAAEIAALIDEIKAAGVPAVFADSTVNPKLAEQVARESGATFYKLYTGSLTEASGEVPTYIDYILVDTRIIVEALGGTVE